jgi:hypothetical protein
VAQLGARLDGIEEVEGSNPFGSTIFTKIVPETWVTPLGWIDPEVPLSRLARSGPTLVLTYCK